MSLRNQRLSLLKQPIASTLNQHLIDYPTPSNLSYWWGFGSLAGICLVIQIVTGVFLAMHYTPHVDLAFNSVEHIMRDVEGGWLLRYMHANGASMFFIVVHLHIFRGLYHASYSSPREFVWCVGVLIFLLMIVTAFIGYVLPWGQMSFWGATVITSLASAIPLVGDSIVTWLWGGFSVDNATLNRFFSLHHLLPFLLVGASLLHLAALHQYGSNNPLGVHADMDKISFYPYFYVKDLVGWVAFAIFFAIWIFLAPNVLGHPDNYIPANPMSTPPHIVPEWYFLPIYAILRSIPDKAGGVAAIAPVFLCLFALPFFPNLYVRSSSFRPIHQAAFWLFLADGLLLGWIGCQPVEAPFVTIGQISPILFFAFFAITALLGQLGTKMPNKYKTTGPSTTDEVRKLKKILKNWIEKHPEQQNEYNPMRELREYLDEEKEKQINKARRELLWQEVEKAREKEKWDKEFDKALALEEGFDQESPLLSEETPCRTEKEKEDCITVMQVILEGFERLSERDEKEYDPVQEELKKAQREAWREEVIQEEERRKKENGISWNLDEEMKDAFPTSSSGKKGHLP